MMLSENHKFKTYYSYLKITSKLSIILLFLFLLQDGFSQQFETLLRSENPIRNVSVFLSVWGLAFISVVLLSFSPIKSVRILWGIVFSISVFTYLTYIHIMGHAPLLGDAKILWVEMGQTKAAFMFYWSKLIYPFFLSLLFFIAFILSPPVLQFMQKKWVSFFSLFLPVIPLLMITVMLVLKGGGAGVGIPGGMFALNAYALSIQYETLTQPNIRRDPVRYKIPEDKKIKNIILVVDESISGDFISLDPAATITPFLANHSDLIVDFGQATSAHNCSSYSNAIMRWGITPDSLVTAENRPTIWQYAKKAGYATTYIDAQKQSGTFGNFMSLNEIKNIDNIIQFDSPQIERDIDYISNDFKAIQKAQELIEKNPYNFIYINKLGAHFPYEGKYPEVASQFEPHMSLFESIGNTSREKLINSYKNVINWNVDGFFKELNELKQMEQTLVVYTSDHGQNLLEEGTDTHCNRNGTSPYQGMVPFLIMTNNQNVLGRLSNAADINKDQVSHFNIFPTILWFMGYPQQQIESDYTNTLFTPVKRLGKFSRGDLFSEDKNKRNFHWSNVTGILKSRMQNENSNIH